MANRLDTRNKHESEILNRAYNTDLSNPDKYVHKPTSINTLLSAHKQIEYTASYKRNRAARMTRSISVAVVACMVLVLGLGYYKPSMFYDASLVKSASSYKQVADALNFIKHKDDTTVFEKIVTLAGDRVNMDMGMSSSMAGGVEMAKSDSSALADFSPTNEQVEGVSEGDIIKTDGKYIYALTNSGMLTSIKPGKGGKMSIVDSLKVTDQENTALLEMYLTGDILSVVMQGNEKVHVNTFSSNKGKLTILDKYSQDGYYLSSRVTGDSLYTITTKYAPVDADPKLPEGFVPVVGKNSTAGCIQPRDITILPYPTLPCFVVATGINLKDKGDGFSSKAVLGTGNTVYCSKDNLYVLGADEKGTNILKFALDEGEITLEANGTVEGTTLNQFSADEYNGNFRVATTKWLNPVMPFAGAANKMVAPSNSINYITVLDKDLKELGKIADLAKGERIYSARFMGDTAYVVTFRQTDPLFVIDLKDPTKPQVRGELKIPGFSNYLHPISDGKLLGIGRNTDDNGFMNGFKMAIFDVTDPSKPKEISKTIVGGNSMSLVDATHKAFFFDKDKQLVGFPFLAQDGNGTQTFNGYVLYEIKDDTIKLKQKFEANISKDDFGISDYGSMRLPFSEYGYYAQRGFYINDVFYIYGYNNLSSFSYKDYKYLNNIVIK